MPLKLVRYRALLLARELSKATLKLVLIQFIFKCISPSGGGHNEFIVPAAIKSFIAALIVNNLSHKESLRYTVGSKRFERTSDFVFCTNFI